MAGHEVEQDLARRDPLQLVETGAQVAPVVQRQHRQRGVDRLIGHGQRLGDAPHRGRGVGTALGEHDGGRLDGDDVASGGLVGAGAGADVHDRAGVVERSVELGDDPGVAAPMAGVSPADPLVEMTGRHPVGRSPSLRWSHDTYRSTWIFTTTRLFSICSTKSRNSSL